MPLLLEHPDLLCLDSLPVKLILTLLHLIVEILLHGEGLKLSVSLHLLAPLLHVNSLSVLEIGRAHV